MRLRSGRRRSRQLLGSLRQTLAASSTSKPPTWADFTTALVPARSTSSRSTCRNLAIATAVPQLEAITIAPDADLIALVKPMFELGLGAPPDGPRPPAGRWHCASSRAPVSGQVLGRVASPIRGANGAIEFFIMPTAVRRAPGGAASRIRRNPYWSSAGPAPSRAARLRPGGRLDHDADEGLGATGAQQHDRPPSWFRPWRLRPRARRRRPRRRAVGHLRRSCSTCGSRVTTGTASPANGRPARQATTAGGRVSISRRPWWPDRGDDVARLLTAEREAAGLSSASST